MCELKGLAGVIGIRCRAKLSLIRLARSLPLYSRRNLRRKRQRLSWIPVGSAGEEKKEESGQTITLVIKIKEPPLLRASLLILILYISYKVVKVFISFGYI